MKRKIIAVALAVTLSIAVLLFAACGGGSPTTTTELTTTTTTPTTTTTTTPTTTTTTPTTTTPTTTPPPAGSFDVLIDTEGLYPNIITVPVGSTVTWINLSDEFCVIQGFLDGLYINSNNIMPWQSWSYTFTQPGRFEYNGALSQSMGMLNGRVIIEEVE